MKILYLDKNRGYSGAEEIIIMIMKLLSKDNEVIYASPKGKIEKHLSNAGLKYIPLPKLTIFNLRKIINEVSPDIIHASDFSMSVLASFSSKKIPVVSHLHSNPSWLKNYFDPRSIVYAVALKNISQVISVSSSISEEYAYKFLLKNKNTVIPNVVNTKNIKKMSIQKPCGINKDFNLVYLGRLYNEKNPILFCKIVKELKKYNNKISAEIIGDGDLKNKVKLYIKQNNLQENISLIGYKSNPFPYVMKAKVGVITSNFEGFGLSAVELLALGLPVVCTNVGGLKEIVTEDCGLRCNNVSDFVIELHKLLNDKKYYKYKSNNARKQAINFSNVDKYKKQIIAIYTQALSKVGRD